MNNFCVYCVDIEKCYHNLFPNRGTCSNKYCLGPSGGENSSTGHAGENSCSGEVPWLGMIPVGHVVGQKIPT